MARNKQVPIDLISRLARDSLWLLTARIRRKRHSVIRHLTHRAARLGAEGFGEYAFISALILIGNVLTTFGSDMYAIREIAAKNDFSEASSVLALQLFLSCLFSGLSSRLRRICQIKQMKVFWRWCIA
ncbi:MAG: hypothetical protein U0V48_05495 [Anaerolineales bacterium]